MEGLHELLERAALFQDLAPADRLYLAGVADQQIYAAGEWLFHESTPRQWVGIIKRGELENFPISGIRLAGFQHFIDALAYIKKAAALANHKLGILDKERADAITTACDELLAGKLHDHERQRGHRQPGPGAPGTREGGVPVPPPQRPREPLPVH
jgi:hypothetical protein